MDFIDTVKDMSFDFVDFDDEGCPLKEIGSFLEVAEVESFYLALTDGSGLNLKMRGKFNPALYGLNGEIRQAEREDYDNFENLVTDAITSFSKGKYNARNISSYRGREGNVLYQTWLFEKINGTEGCTSDCDNRQVDMVEDHA